MIVCYRMCDNELGLVLERVGDLAGDDAGRRAGQNGGLRVDDGVHGRPDLALQIQDLGDTLLDVDCILEESREQHC